MRQRTVEKLESLPFAASRAEGKASIENANSCGAVRISTNKRRAKRILLAQPVSRFAPLEALASRT